MSAASGIATGLFTSAAAGILGALLLAPFSELRRFFFAFNAGLALAFLCMTLPLRLSPGEYAPHTIAGGAARGAAVASVAAAVLTIAYITSLYITRQGRMRSVLYLALAAACMAALLDGWGAARGGPAAWAFGVNALASAALLGSVIVATILGHWYLVRSKMSIDHLVLFSRLFIWAIVLRAAVLAVGLTAFGATSSAGIGATLTEVTVDSGFFFWWRVALGLLGPAVFAYMIHETARIRSTQSATGILYLAVLFVLTGELLARFLTVAGAGPI